MILWRGSGFGKEKIQAVLTGLNGKSNNSKIGDMTQIWILPQENLSYKKNDGVCGNCPLSGKACYVNLIWGTRAVFQKAKQLTLSKWNEVKKVLSSNRIRFGAYGEPVLLPFKLVEKIAKTSNGWTGYSHQWSEPKYQPYKKFFMASVETEKQKEEANKLGWRTYRIVSKEEDILPTESICPASNEYFLKTNKDITCAQCLLCCGTSKNVRDIAIVAHGSKGKVSNLLKILSTEETSVNDAA